MARKFVAGNWKMFTTASSARQLAQAVHAAVASENGTRVAVCPPFPYLHAVADTLKGSPVELGAQNVYPEKEGAFTGEVSTSMLADLGCKLVIIGHSERRHKLGERDDFINRKVHASLAAGLEVILCLGETLADRELGFTDSVLATQIDGGLAGIKPEQFSKITLAYEPVWAIGTGQNATPEQAQQAHAFIRGRIAAHAGAAVADSLIIQYGGSVKPENARILFHQPDVDGGLIGGASLNADQFAAIVKAARP